VKALAVREPWATLIASGRKTIEVRTWRTNYRGPLVIVASGKVEREVCERFGVTPQPSTLAALVDLVDVRRLRARDARAACMPPIPPWRDEFFAWILTRPRALVRRSFTRSRLMTFEISARLVRIRKGGYP
jgi:hypothetical protein